MNQITIKDLDVRFENFEEKIDRKMDQRFADLEVKIDRKMDKRFADFESKIDRKLDLRFTNFEAKIDRKFDDLALMINKGFKEAHKNMLEAVKGYTPIGHHDALKARVKRIERGLGIQSI